MNELTNILWEREIAQNRVREAEKIEYYKRSLKGVKKTKLQETLISLDLDSKFSEIPDSCLNGELIKNFEKQYNVPIKSMKDLKYLSYAVAEKWEELELQGQKRIIQIKDKKNKSLRNLVGAAILATNIFFTPLSAPQPPIHQDSYPSINRLSYEFDEEYESSIYMIHNERNKNKIFEYKVNQDKTKNDDKKIIHFDLIKVIDGNTSESKEITEQ